MSKIILVKPTLPENILKFAPMWNSNPETVLEHELQQRIKAAEDIIIKDRLEQSKEYLVASWLYTFVEKEHEGVFTTLASLYEHFLYYNVDKANESILTKKRFNIIIPKFLGLPQIGTRKYNYAKGYSGVTTDNL